MRLYSIRFPLDIIGQILCGLLVGLASFPTVVFIYKGIAHKLFENGLIGMLYFSIALGIGYFLFAFSLILLSGVIRHLLCLNGREGEMSIYSWKILGFTIYHGLINVVDQFALKLFRSTGFITMFFKLMGLKVGKETIINSTKISDCDLIRIGNKCVIGGDVIINGHSVEGERLIRKKVEIGNNVTLGQYVTILPGVIIEDNVIVGANSVVPKNKILEKGKIYGGVPAKIIGPSQNEIIDDKDSSGEYETGHPILEQRKEEFSFTKTVDNADVLLRSYSMRHNEILNIERFIYRAIISGLVLLVTVIVYSLLNNQPKLLALLPPISGIIYASTINSSTSMLKIAAHMYRIELLFKKAKISDFNWEIKEGALGIARGFDLDNIVISSVYMGSFAIGMLLTYNGQLIGNNERYLGYPLRDIVILIDLIIVGLVIFSLAIFVLKRRHYLRKLNADSSP